MQQEKINEIIQCMTIKEKIKVLAGKDFWHIYGIRSANLPSILITDGPHGLRKKVKSQMGTALGTSVLATSFPTASGLACSFNEELLEKMGNALGEECRKEDVSVLLGPGVNIKRNPLCGRNFEYFSEDPLVAGKMGAALIRGIQKTGVGACVKHFAGNSQETARLVTDSIIDDRALREIYLRAFEICIKESAPWTVMSAYNLLNGVYCSGNKKLLTEILRNEWGFSGCVMSDWGAVDDPILDLQAGLDLKMPGKASGSDKAIYKAFLNKEINEEDISRATSEIINLLSRAKESLNIPFSCNMDAHIELARKTAEECAVLLKNEGTLPQKETNAIAVIGEMAKYSRYQGAGSSRINPYILDSALEGFEKNGIPFTYAKGYDIKENKVDDNLIQEAISIVKNKKTVYLFVGLPDSYESEGFDRKDIQLPRAHTLLIEKICAIHKNVVVVVQAGGVVDLSWKDLPQAILFAYLGGCQVGNALVNIILGKINPSGKLAETFIKNIKDIPSYSAYPALDKQAIYKESIFVGYRYFDYFPEQVEYPFGFGLSYTTYKYDKINIRKKIENEETYSVNCSIKNSGSIRGKETVFLYVGKKETKICRPIKELVGFTKVDLLPGEEKAISLELNERSLSYFNISQNAFLVEDGTYEIMICSSGEKIELSETLLINRATKQTIKTRNESSQTDLFGGSYKNISRDFSLDDFKIIYQKEIPILQESYKGTYTINSTMREIADTKVGKVLKILMGLASKSMAKGDETEKRMIDASFIEMPLRQLIMNPMFTQRKIEGLVDITNGKGLKGLFKLL